ncbi:predicted protein [Naegleria gruberi]|uniref:Predicted protein n=1 Tax=Naegleria gruberi TaxID=5762 RepID=D2VVB0_NAEGR|nr:uncharacterized protein NAEGRDRAFT_72952 [Naegleria gruberi]EFC39203.1 predicted protein [Naegleria gruberi]|eukprot:XP_002671947.1 predicted protein [Naegleria gruberi strain NEG-M]
MMLRRRAEDELQLSATIIKVENLQTDPNSVYAILTFNQVQKKVSTADKNLEGKNSYEWSDNNNVLFKEIPEFCNERLKIEVRDKQSDKLIGMTTTSLESLPKNLEITRKLKLYDTKNAVVHLRMKAIGFGVEQRLFEVHSKIMPFLRSIHTPTDAMRNVVIIPMTMENFFGLEPAIEALKKIRERSSPVATHALFPVLLIFPGKYLVRETIKLTAALNGLVIFGITDSKDSRVEIIPYKKSEPIFDLSVDVNIIHMHGLTFEADSLCVKAINPTTKLEAYSCDLSKIWPPNSSVADIVNYEFFGEENMDEEEGFY